MHHTILLYPEQGRSEPPQAASTELGMCGEEMDECARLQKQLFEIQEQLRMAVADKKQLKADNKALQEQLTSCHVGRQAQDDTEVHLSRGEIEIAHV